MRTWPAQEEQRIAEVLSQMAGAGKVEVALFYGGETDALGARTAGPTGAVVVAEGADDLSVRVVADPCDGGRFWACPRAPWMCL